MTMLLTVDSVRLLIGEISLFSPYLAAVSFRIEAGSLRQEGKAFAGLSPSQLVDLGELRGLDLRC